MSDSRELAHHEGQGGAIAAADAAATGGDRFMATITMVREAMLNPAVDAEKAKVMADLMTNLEDRQLASEFNRDLNAAIMEMPVITKAGIIVIPANRERNTPARTQGRFARFEDIDRVVRPILQRHNLALRFEVDESTRGVVSVRPIISHANGHTERGGAMHLPLDDSGAKNKVQGVGSAVQYGKRYTMCALLNIVTEGTDDDGSLGRAQITMPHERAETVLAEAEAAATEGRYVEFFAAQGVKDRAWLIGEGHHARLGGGTALPDGTAGREEGPAQRPREDPPQQDQRPPAQQEGHDVSTPEGWTAQYEDDCRAAPDLETLQRVQAKGAAGLKKLQTRDAKLHERAIAAGTAAAARLRGEEGAASGGTTGGSDLFAGGDADG